MHGWRLLLGRLPTRDELCKRGILNEAQNLVCPLCSQVAESGAHMGFSCTFSKEVWRKVGSWLGISLTFNCVGEDHFVQFRRLIKGRIHHEQVLPLPSFSDAFIRRTVQNRSATGLCNSPPPAYSIYFQNWMACFVEKKHSENCKQACYQRR